MASEKISKAEAAHAGTNTTEVLEGKGPQGVRLEAGFQHVHRQVVDILENADMKSGV